MLFYNFSPKLLMWYIEAMVEKRCWKPGQTVCHDYALFPERWCRAVASLNHEIKYDYCFIGGYHTDPETAINRAWLLDFIKQHFNDNSYLQFTDKATKAVHTKLGLFDFTQKKQRFVPKEVEVQKRNYFDKNYFSVMAQSQFCLCPAGDALYSMRFYEALMCKSIPIVNSREETFRSEAESRLDYKYYITKDSIEYRQDWVDHNHKLFLQHHTLQSIDD